MYLQVPEGSTIAIFSEVCVSECQATSILLKLQKMADEEAWRKRVRGRKEGLEREWYYLSGGPHLCQLLGEVSPLLLNVTHRAPTLAQLLQLITRNIMYTERECSLYWDLSYIALVSPDLLGSIFLPHTMLPPAIVCPVPSRVHVAHYHVLKMRPQDTRNES